MSQNRAVERFVQSGGLESASVGIAIQRVSNGEIIAQHNPLTSTRLASVTKLFPTWLALENYGDDYRYTTKISHTGQIEHNTLIGDIVITPSGDPTFNSRYFANQDVISEITKIIKNHKIKEIKGRIIIDKGEQYEIPGSWVWEDISNYYAATPHPINFRDNSYTIEFRSGNVGELTEIINTHHKPDNITLHNEVVASSGSSDNAWIYGGIYSKDLYIKGSIPSNRDSFKIRGATPSPERVMIAEMEQYFSAQNINIANKELYDKELTLTPIGELKSPTLREIISVTNKVSCNLFAEALGVLVGGQQWSSRVEELLKERGIYCEGLNLRDASGLSPQSVASARTISELLTYIAQRDGEDIFSNTLAICGEERSMSVYGYPTLNQKLRAKTGSMADVQSLAGYIESKSGEMLSFCILVNYFTCPRAELQEAISALLLEL